jgi:hypothetical protein
MYLDKLHIGRDPVACMQDDQVLRHELLGPEDHDRAVTKHHHAARKKFAKLLGSALSAVFLGKCERTVQQNDYKDGDAQLRHSSEDCHCSGYPQH